MAWLLLLACMPQLPVEGGGPDTASPRDRDRDGSLRPDDCDDADPTVFPGADERCDGVDQDCDGAVDEGLQVEGFRDADGDGWGDTTLTACDDPAWVERGGDCDDGDDTVHPDAPEFCDSVDQDCDGPVDEDAVDATTWYRDRDGDDWGADDETITACDADANLWQDRGGDCDDGDDAIHPGADEDCDGVDQNCSGAPDEGAGVCPCPIAQYAGHAYATCTEKVNWDVAKWSCEQFGYHLVYIQSGGENSFVAAQMSGVRFWAGATDRADEGTWAWASGTEVSWDAWGSGEPNGSWEENCLEVNRREDGRWNDYECWEPVGFVCES